jgi:aminopeptidase-like protein
MARQCLAGRRSSESGADLYVSSFRLRVEALALGGVPEAESAMVSGIFDLLDGFDAPAAGASIFGFAERAFPICRSITGDGVRQTLGLLAEIVPGLERREVPTGTQVFDWQVPREWNVTRAFLVDPEGRKRADFADSNLHLLNYSVPVDRTMPLAELRPHLYSLPARPAAIPYRTSYFKEHWGFCLAHQELESLPEGDYRVVIESRLEPGHLTYGELFLPGELPDTVLLSAHLCHPSLANDNLSALGVLAHLGALLSSLPSRRYGYRLVFAPGTVGAITWLAQNEAAARRIRHGLVAANLGDGGRFHYKRSRRGDAPIDRAVALVLRDAGEPHAIEDFVPFGYDERQYNSPGFALDVGSLTRTPWGRYPEYHSSDDNLSLIRPEHLALSLRRYLEVVAVLEANRTYLNLSPFCEPQLGRRGLYSHIGGRDDGREFELALLWVLNQSDGEHDLMAIAERSGAPFRRVADAAAALVAANLLQEHSPVAAS